MKDEGEITMKTLELQKIANEVRKSIVTAVHAAKVWINREILWIVLFFLCYHKRWKSKKKLDE